MNKNVLRINKMYILIFLDKKCSGNKYHNNQLIKQLFNYLTKTKSKSKTKSKDCFPKNVI